MSALPLLVTLGLLGAASKVVNFDAGPPGQAPPGWTVAMTNAGGPPHWEILPDRTAPTPPYVLAQVSDDPTGNRYPLAILDSPPLRDGDVSVRIKPVAGREERAGGLVWRYRDANNYYLALANARSGKVALFRVENGLRVRLNPGVLHEIPSGAWSILKVSVRGNRFQVYLNHRRILQATDSAFRDAGKVGLWTEADSVTYFDDFRVYPK